MSRHAFKVQITVRPPRPDGAAHDRVLYRLGVRLISCDRPGYGKSARHPKRRVLDAARDVAAIADERRLGKFGVVGRSGGGPHALACTALLPDRVRTAAVVVSVVLLCHGADDVFSLVTHTRWLASQMPGAQAEAEHGAAHFDAVKVLPRILARL